MPSFSEARALAEQVLAHHLPERWRAVQAVTREALRVAELVDVDRDAVIRSAVLHGIGSSPVVVRSGFPPLDAARFLAARGYDARVVALVAHHAAAVVEARRRGIDALGAFEDEASPTRDALWYCIAVAGPIDARQAGEPALRAAVERTTDRLDAAGMTGPGP